jgi:hypothetical protein
MLRYRTESGTQEGSVQVVTKEAETINFHSLNSKHFFVHSANLGIWLISHHCFFQYSCTLLVYLVLHHFVLETPTHQFNERC